MARALGRENLNPRRPSGPQRLLTHRVRNLLVQALVSLVFLVVFGFCLVFCGFSITHFCLGDVSPTPVLSLLWFGLGNRFFKRLLFCLVVVFSLFFENGFFLLSSFVVLFFFFFFSLSLSLPSLSLSLSLPHAASA